MFFTSCSSSNNSNKKPNESTIANNNGIGEATVSDEDYGMDEKEVAGNINVTPYTYSYGNYSNLALVLTNNSEYDCGLEVKVTFFNTKNKKITDASDSVPAFAKGTSTVSMFSCNEKFKSYKYEINAIDISGSYIPITKNLISSVKITNGTNYYNEQTKLATVTVKNNGKNAVDDITVIALFFKGKKLVGTNYENIYDNISPKKTAKVEMDFTRDFDSVKVFLNGYKYVY